MDFSWIQSKSLASEPVLARAVCFSGTNRSISSVTAFTRSESSEAETSKLYILAGRETSRPSLSARRHVADVPLTQMALTLDNTGPWARSSSASMAVTQSRASSYFSVSSHFNEEVNTSSYTHFGATLLPEDVFFSTIDIRAPEVPRSNPTKQSPFSRLSPTLLSMELLLSSFLRSSPVLPLPSLAPSSTSLLPLPPSSAPPSLLSWAFACSILWKMVGLPPKVLELMTSPLMFSLGVFMPSGWSSFGSVLILTSLMRSLRVLMDTEDAMEAREPFF
mmetsp:Transcript_37589/g.80174  ORF Transcript_37589/g.80174 Transcript_37589/m.80174 type:complete len:277 (+) Transcript_37589:1001-1831(+)